MFTYIMVIIYALAILILNRPQESVHGCPNRLYG